MAVLVASDSYLPKGLTFGPTNGPEDFQELVFVIFSRRLYKEWFLFLDDLACATGRPAPHPPGPSGAHDVVTRVNEMTEKMKASKGLGYAASSFPSPTAHIVALLVLVFALFWVCSVWLAWLAAVSAVEEAVPTDDPVGPYPGIRRFLYGLPAWFRSALGEIINLPSGRLSVLLRIYVAIVPVYL